MLFRWFKMHILSKYFFILDNSQLVLKMSQILHLNFFILSFLLNADWPGNSQAMRGGGRLAKNEPVWNASLIGWGLCEETYLHAVTLCIYLDACVIFFLRNSFL